MGNINVLDEKTINKIAAGEVVERPASIVKELVENAIDAKATAITVEIKDGGIKLIRITDNGSGIAYDDIKVAFLRHTTSKIKQAEDLFDIHSLGFRGEALASISAVSRVELMTKTHEDFVGSRYIIEGGKEQSFDEIGCPEGTTIIVANLFFNTPARQKFLKSPQTEAGYIQDIVQKLALGNPHISFKLIINQQNKLFTAGNHQLLDCILQIHGRDITKNLIPIDCELPLFKLKGFIGKPFISRGNRGYEHMYINNRFVRSRVLEKAVEDGYDTFLTINKFPFCVLSIEVNTDKVDVNVHPAKLEVRIDQEREMYEMLKNTIREKLTQGNLIPKSSLHDPVKEKPAWQSQNIPEPFETVKREAFLKTNHERPKEELEDKSGMTTYQSIPIAKEPLGRSIIKALNPEVDNPMSSRRAQTQTSIHNTKADMDKIPHRLYETITPVKQYKSSETYETKEIVKQEVREQIQLDVMDKEQKLVKRQIIGQLFNTYWLVELENELYFVDQHAAHEKILYEKMMTDFNQSHFDSQQLLEPQVIRLSILEANTLESQLDYFKQIGFDLEVFGPDTYILRGVPRQLSGGNEAKMLMDILDQAVSEKSSGHSIWHERLALAACKAAVKAHDKLSEKEYRRLIQELLDLENPFTCPHGRPIIISMSQYEIEKKFKRIQ